MNYKPIKRKWILTAAFCLLTVGNAGADTVYNDDLIVEGGACIGFDCVNGETFNDNIKLKENNTRIHLLDSADTSGNGWKVTANDSNDGGDSYMAVNRVTERGLVGDGIIDGYDSFGVYQDPIPLGDPVFDSDGNPVWIEENALRVNAGAGSGVALGEGATTSNGTVSVGSAGNERRLVHVADGINDYDALTMGQMMSYDPLAFVGEYLAQIDNQQAHTKDLDDRLNGSAAAAAALSALSPNGRAAGRNSLGIGIGSYEGSVAMALGYFYLITENSIINVALSKAKDMDDLVSRIGFSYQF